MADQKPWFLVMTPGDANRPDSQWVRQGAASRGKIVAIPIAPEGWIALVRKRMTRLPPRPASPIIPFRFRSRCGGSAGRGW